LGAESSLVLGVYSFFLPHTPAPAKGQELSWRTLLMPFFFRKLGVKWMVLVGMGAWVLRYLLFAWGAPEQVVWMLFLGIALHGICYDFFFVTGFMYADRVAPKEVRGQAQSLLVFLTQGVGMYFGYQVAFGKFGAGVTKYGDLDAVIFFLAFWDKTKVTEDDVAAEAAEAPEEMP
jgi:hypothetical protein